MASFIGVSGIGDVAGYASGVPGGYGDQACASYSAIGAGVDSVIGSDQSDVAARSFIGAGTNNGITAGEAFVGAGNNDSAQSGEAFVGAGFYNVASGQASFVGGGGSTYWNVQTGLNVTPTLDNSASGTDSFVGAGDLNQVSGFGSFIGAGGYTYALTKATSAANQVAGTDSFIGDGDQNSVAADDAFVGGGKSNGIAAQATYSAIAGGSTNSVSGEYGAIAGGIGSKVSGTGAAVGGGEANLASGAVATIPGGYHNVASGSASFAAGYGAEAANNGAFVWADESSTARVKSTINNEFLARASGGVYFYSNAASTVGVRLASGSGAWSSLSDRNMKTEIAPLDGAAVLEKVAALPLSVWSYRTEPGVRHVGPMAQDFYAAFGVGEDDRHIASIDEDGVALAAIKALHAENRALNEENRTLHAENRELRAYMERGSERLARDEALRSRDEARLLALERKVAASPNPRSTPALRKT